MGKVVGLIGSVRGKVGNTVYAVTNGIQTVRVYNPTVSNPKSSSQSLQRSKANLAGRMSSFVPRTAIMGLGGNARIRRGAFLSNILKNADAVQTGGEFVAKIDPAKVLFSKGNVALPVTAGAITATANNVAIVLTGAAETVIDPAIYGTRLIRLVAMVYESNSTDLVEVSTKLATMPAQGESVATNIAIAHNGNYEVYVYAIPMSTDNGTSASVDTSVVGLDDQEIAASLSVNGNAVALVYGRSVLLGNGNFIQA